MVTASIKCLLAPNKTLLVINTQINKHPDNQMVIRMFYYKYYKITP